MLTRERLNHATRVGGEALGKPRASIGRLIVNQFDRVGHFYAPIGIGEMKRSRTALRPLFSVVIQNAPADVVRNRHAFNSPRPAKTQFAISGAAASRKPGATVSTRARSSSPYSSPAVIALRAR